MVLVSCAREEGHDDLIELIKQTREFGENKVTIGVGGRSVQDAPEVFLSAGADFFAVNLLQFAEDTLPKYSSGRRRGS
jgi:methylmalonyl-CoA mutase cobalamin-binding subunit